MVEDESDCQSDRNIIFTLTTKLYLPYSPKMLNLRRGASLKGQTDEELNFD